MKINMKNIVVILSFLPLAVSANDSVSYKKSTIIYGYRDGHALIMEQMVPLNANGRAIIGLANGNYRSDPSRISEYTQRYQVYLEEGFTVFVVATSSQPRYTIPEQLEDVKKCIRFIKSNALKYNLHPQKIGITGASSGGSLSLLAATTWNNTEPVDSAGRVAAVAVFYPPTDFINYGKLNPEGQLNYKLLRLTGLSAAFDFKRWNDTTRTFVSITDTSVIRTIVESVSPVYSVSPGDPPVYIIHGDTDILVPLQQSQRFAEMASKAGVMVNLEIKKNASHGWPGREDEERKFARWFVKVLQ